MTDDASLDVRAALIAILIDPTGTPSPDSRLRTYLIHCNWAHPHSWFDLSTDHVRNEWRITFKAETYLRSNPPSVEEMGVRY